jgi:4-hydroxybenzoate polyprenyltransferase
MIIVTQYLAAIFIVFRTDSFLAIIFRKDLCLLVLATILLAAGGNIINDYFDVKIDSVNKPKKLIIDHFIKRRTALVLHAIFTLSGIALSLLLNNKIFIISTITGILLWIYSYQLKRKPFVGNVLVSLLTAIAVYLPALLIDKPSRMLMVFALFAFFVSLIREIIKDIEDMKGDGLFGCQTLPLLYGMRTTKKIIVGITITFIVTQLIIAIFAGNVRLLFTCGCCFFILLYFLKKLLPADTKNEFKSLSKFCKWLMLGGILSMMFV